MTTAQKLTIRASEIRQKLNELASVEALTDEQRTDSDKLSTEYRDVETKLRAATVVDGVVDLEEKAKAKPDGEGQEKKRIEDRANLGEMIQNIVEHRANAGAEKELVEAYKLGENQVPLSMLEVRAVTPAPSDVGQNQANIIPGVFPTAAHSFMGVATPRVGTGEAVYPILTTNASAHTPAENASAAETTGSFTADVLSPARIQAAFFFSREDRARFSGMSESLRQNLSMALMDGLDEQIIANSTTGLLAGGITAPGNPSARAAWTDFKAAVTSAVDGTYADGPESLRVLIGAPTYTRATEVYRGTTTENEDGYEVMRRLSGGVRVSAHVPGVVSKRQDAIVARAMSMTHAVCPIWDSITLIPDEITLAASGQIKLTAVMLYQFKVIRSAGYVRVRFQTAA